MLNQLNIEDNLDEDGNYYSSRYRSKLQPVWGTYYVQTEGVVITLSYY